MRNVVRIALAFLSAAVVAHAQPPLRVVTTLSTYADLVETIGGDRVDVKSVVPPRFNPHFIEPRPSDVLNVKKADLFVHSGLDLELWRGPLIDAAGNLEVRPGGPRELDLSTGVRLLEVPDRNVSRAEGDIHLYGNPHYWLDPNNGLVMAAAIAAKLSAIDPGSQAAYQARYATFEQRLESKIIEWKSLLAPHADMEVIGYHNQWPYLMEFAGLSMRQFIESKPGIPPSPKHLKFLGEYIDNNRVRVIVYSKIFSDRAVNSLAKRTDALPVTLVQAVGEVPEARGYIKMIDYNITQLASSLR